MIRLDFSVLSIKNVETFESSLLSMLEQIGEKYHIELPSGKDLNSSFTILLQSLCNTNNPSHFPGVAVLIDEYDHPILHTLDKPELAVEIRNVLKSFSCVIKAKAELVKFVFVTGVSAFSKSGLSSGLNNLDNITMDEKYSSICGYTDSEVDYYFKKHIESWATTKNILYSTLRKDLKTWYNGYCFKENTPTIYSPFTFTLAIKKNELQNFWFESATPYFLLSELAKEERKSELKLLELKLNLPPEEGLKQIKSQKYYEPLLLLEDAILGLGISFLRKKASGKEKSVFEVSYALEEIKK